MTILIKEYKVALGEVVVKVEIDGIVSGSFVVQNVNAFNTTVELALYEDGIVVDTLLFDRVMVQPSWRKALKPFLDTFIGLVAANSDTDKLASYIYDKFRDMLKKDTLTFDYTKVESGVFLVSLK